MLLGKLATPATKVYQNGGFNTTTATAEYIAVSALRYVIGENITEFELRYGNILLEDDQERFDILLRENIKMSSDELLTWGTDDSVLLDLIATKLGTSIIEKVTKDLHHTY